MFFDNNIDFMSNDKKEGSCGCPEDRVCHRYFEYEVPHFQKVITKVVNHHVYKHTYIPVYCMEEENVCENVFDTCKR